MMRYKKVHKDGKTLYEHRVKMEEYLNKKLTSDEFVHHKNGNKLDNRLENLEVISRGEHKSLHLNEYYKTPESNIRRKQCSLIARCFRKLNEMEVKDIRESIRNGEKRKNIVEKYNISRQVVYLIGCNKSYKEVL